MDAPTDDKKAAPLNEGAARRTDSNNPAGVRPDGTKAPWTPENPPLTEAAVAKVWKKRRRRAALPIWGHQVGFENGEPIFCCDGRDENELGCDDASALEKQRTTDILMKLGVDQRTACLCASALFAAQSARDVQRDGRDERPFDEADGEPAETFEQALQRKVLEVLGIINRIAGEEATYAKDQDPTIPQRAISIAGIYHLAEMPGFDVSSREIAKAFNSNHDTVNKRIQRLKDRMESEAGLCFHPPAGAKSSRGGVEDAEARNRNRRQRGSGRPPKSGGATPAEICGRWGLESGALMGALERAGDPDKLMPKTTAHRRRRDALDAGEVVKVGEIYYAAGAVPAAEVDAKTNE